MQDVRRILEDFCKILNRMVISIQPAVLIQCKVDQNCFHHSTKHRFLMGHHCQSLSVDTTIMMSTNCPMNTNTLLP